MRPRRGGGGGGSHRRHRPDEGAMSSCNAHSKIMSDILSRLPVKSVLRFRCAVVVKGVPYWIVYPEEEDEFNVGEIFLWFDVGNEPCIYLMSSCQCQGFFVPVYSSAVHALLPLSGFEDPNEFVDMWVMEDSGVGGRDCSWIVGVVLVLGDYLKDEAWLKLLCSYLKVFFTQLASLICPTELEDNQVQVVLSE
ncbi:hypothetical protein HYC85_018106 [Camellia sinensis]|uniref:Uncharacterized protein n=1 Tax=Camellia sinensis TaxID=4442 RepID=A0A7J7GTC5_CAMSI|nr:hypothetical protein HYC85_018106 [Camellia sinensis]